MRKVPLDIPSELNPNDTIKPLTQSIASDIAKHGPSTPQVLDNVIHDEMDNDTLFGVIRRKGTRTLAGGLAKAWYSLEDTAVDIPTSCWGRERLLV